VAEDSKILFGVPNQRPSPIGLKGYFFVDYITPTLYFSVGTSWVTVSSGTITYAMVIAALNYVPEDVANKALNLTSPDNTKYPTTLAVANAIAAISSTQFKKLTLVSGAINGSNKVFVWNYAPIQVFWQNSKLVEGAASNGYTLAGVTTTFTDAPFTGESVEAYGNF